jgi:hypothetical protein
MREAKANAATNWLILLSLWLPCQCQRKTYTEFLVTVQKMAVSLFKLCYKTKPRLIFQNVDIDGNTVPVAVIFIVAILVYLLALLLLIAVHGHFRVRNMKFKVVHPTVTKSPLFLAFISIEPRGLSP